MKVTFRGSSDRHVVVFTAPDLSVSPAFSSKAPGSPNCKFLAMRGAAYQNEQTYTRPALILAATEFRDAIERDRDLLPYHYSHESGIGEMRSRGSGGVGGFRINGKIHSIWGGAGVCYLEEEGRRADGWGYTVRTIDVRGQKQIGTDDFGTIKIYRRKLKLTLFESIPVLVSFLSGSKDEVFRVLATENNPSFMDLIRLAAEGSGANDWAGTTPRDG